MIIFTISLDTILFLGLHLLKQIISDPGDPDPAPQNCLSDSFVLNTYR
jgi:hypothetical protein